MRVFTKEKQGQKHSNKEIYFYTYTTILRGDIDELYLIILCNQSSCYIRFRVELKPIPKQLFNLNQWNSFLGCNLKVEGIRLSATLLDPTTTRSRKELICCRRHQTNFLRPFMFTFLRIDRYTIVSPS